MALKSRTAPKPKADDLLFADLCAEQIEPRREYAFHSEHNWRFDFAYPLDCVRVAVEIEGRGRHQTPAGFAADCQKYNAALASGWRVLRYPYSYVTNHKRRARIVEQVKRVLCGVECEASDAVVLIGE